MNMRILKYVAIIMVMFVATVEFAFARNGKENKTLFVFGVATSFNDSTAYFTQIQELDSVALAGKTGMLVNKQEYSYQLRDFMGSKGNAHATCVTVNAESRKAIEKIYSSMRQRLARKDGLFVKDIPAEEFKYVRVVMAE